MRSEIAMHTLGYVASALFLLVELGLFVGFVITFVYGRRAKRFDRVKLVKLYQITKILMILAAAYPILAMLFAASLGTLDSFGIGFLVLAISPVVVERQLIGRESLGVGVRGRL